MNHTTDRSALNWTASLRSSQWISCVTGGEVYAVHLWSMGYRYMNHFLCRLFPSFDIFFLSLASGDA